MKEPSSNTIELDKMKIDDAIESSGKYDEDGVFIKKWEGGETESDNKDKYICDISKNSCRYIGTLDNKFQKEGYGVQIFENGDKYFGQFMDDERNEDGIYFWSPTKNETENRIQSEIYFGNWKNNKKDVNGMYIWVDEPEGNMEYENANFDAFVGEFDEERYIRGTYLSKDGDFFCLYHGNFDRTGKKTDENAFFYTSKTNRIFFGKMIKDSLVSGFLGNVDLDSDDVKDLMYCDFNEDGSVNEILETNKLDQEDVEDLCKKISLFKSVIFDGNYFLKVYNKYAKAKYKADNVFSEMSVFDDKEAYRDMLKLLSRYKRNNIYMYIEENFFGRDF